MSRKALLIEASQIKGCNDLPGARVDVENYRAFLESPIGGAWKSDEIKVLSHPSKSDLDRWIRIAGLSDYAFIAFSGHGHHVKGQDDLDETRLCINNDTYDDEIAVHALNPGNPRCLIIADACRKVTRIEADARVAAFQFSLRESMDALRPNPARCRALFDASVERAEKGAITMYSCDLDEAAGESNRGGYFSRGLVVSGENWSENRDPGVFWSDSAFRAASVLMADKSPQQHPKMEAGRRTVHFPFAVLAH